MRSRKKIMSATWKTKFNEELGGREVSGAVFSEGGYRVTSTQREDYPGHFSSAGDSHIMLPPSPAGTPFSVEGETLEELQRELDECGEFTIEQAVQIVEWFCEK
jgi:hypothetical protein